jgi:hypothetical protein
LAIDDLQLQLMGTSIEIIQGKGATLGRLRNRAIDE